MQRLGPAGIFRVLLVVVGASFVGVAANAQDASVPASASPPAGSASEPAKATAPTPAPAAPAPATSEMPAQQPATATTPAVPAPGSQPSALKPGDSATPAAGARKEVIGTGSSLLPHDLSPYGMFMNADIVVKGVMIGLIFASFVTWTILLAKALEIAGAKMRAKRALNDLAEAESLAQAVTNLKSPRAPVTRLAQAALAETERSRGLAAEGVKERATALLSRIEARAGRAMTRGTSILATIGSTAPFVGLFGTVWGIMNSFIGISKTNTTNLAVVAPGIAEALLATACGLVAAIPAVIIYNAFARSISGYRSLLNDAAVEVLRLLSRDLDRESGTDGLVPMGRRAAAE